MATKRVLFDTNLFLAYLLSANPGDSAVGLLLDAAARGVFELIFPIDVLAELNAVVARRPNLAKRVEFRQIEVLVRRVSAFSIVVPLLDEVPPRVCRDLNDDFLIAMGVLYRADFLVTRDRDLIELDSVLDMHILDPGSFLKLVQAGFEE